MVPSGFRISDVVVTNSNPAYASCPSRVNFLSILMIAALFIAASRPLSEPDRLGKRYLCRDMTMSRLSKVPNVAMRIDPVT